MHLSMFTLSRYAIIFFYGRRSDRIIRMLVACHGLIFLFINPFNFIFQKSTTLILLLHLSLHTVDEGHAVNPSEYKSTNVLQLYIILFTALVICNFCSIIKEIFASLNVLNHNLQSFSIQCCHRPLKFSLMLLLVKKQRTKRQSCARLKTKHNINFEGQKDINLIMETFCFVNVLRLKIMF